MLWRVFRDLAAGERPTGPRSSSAGRERGSTLIELLAATAIMGIAVVSILVGSTTTFTSSAQNRDQTTAGIVARNYAEALSVAVTTSNWCQPPAANPYGVTYAPPASYPVTVTYGACPSAGTAPVPDACRSP